jgi:hypothetical protein
MFGCFLPAQIKLIINDGIKRDLKHFKRPPLTVEFVFGPYFAEKV